MRDCRFGPPLWNFNTLPERGRGTARDGRRLMMQETPRERVRVRYGRGKNWVIEVYETTSPTTERLVVGFEVQTGFGLRMGWMFLRDHLAADSRRICEIPELFVWPIFRRMGIARYLEATAVEYATSWGCAEVHLMMKLESGSLGHEPLR